MSHQLMCSLPERRRIRNSCSNPYRFFYNLRLLYILFSILSDVHTVICPSQYFDIISISLLRRRTCKRLRRRGIEQLEFRLQTAPNSASFKALVAFNIKKLTEYQRSKNG